MRFLHRFVCISGVVLAVAALVLGGSIPADAAGVRDRKMHEGTPSYFGDADVNFGHRQAYYDDESDTFLLYDDYKNGKSVIVVVWKKGHYNHRIRYWNPYGVGAGAYRKHGWKENTRLRAKVCKGEFARKGEGKKVVTACGRIVKFRS